MGLLRLSLLILALAGFAQMATAGTVHQVRFAQTGHIMVWQDDALVGQGPQVSLSATRAAPAPSLMGSGHLQPVPASFVTGAESTMLEVASNAGFVILLADSSHTDDVEILPLGTGANATLQARPVGGSGLVLFEQTSKTAIRKGEPRSQAIQLEVRWSGSVAPELIIESTGS